MLLWQAGRAELKEILQPVWFEGIPVFPVGQVVFTTFVASPERAPEAQLQYRRPLRTQEQPTYRRCRVLVSV